MKYRITYTIVDGEHEYGDEIVLTQDKPPTMREAIAEVILNWTDYSDIPTRRLKEHAAKQVKQYELEGWFECGYDYRIIKHIAVEPIEPAKVLVWVDGGVAYTAHDDDVQVEIIDLDDLEDLPRREREKVAKKMFRDLHDLHGFPLPGFIEAK
jgi:hypothetical protein